MVENNCIGSRRAKLLFDFDTVTSCKSEQKPNRKQYGTRRSIRQFAFSAYNIRNPTRGTGHSTNKQQYAADNADGTDQET
jgi:hypothetical protein